MQALAGEFSLPTVEIFTDYSKWERRPSSRSGASGGWSVGRNRWTKTRKKHSHHCQSDALSLAAARLSQSGVSVDQAPTHTHTHSHSSRKISNYSPPRRHLNASRPEKKISKAHSEATLARYSLLKMQLETRQKSINKFTNYKDDLLAANLKVIGHIRQEEDEKFTSKNTMVGRSDDESTVQELLEKYRKSRGSVAALKKKAHRDNMEVETELERTRQWVHEREEDLLREVHEAEVLLQAKMKERDVLKGFKEKEYMVNQVTIDRLRDEIKQHAQYCEESMTLLNAQIAEERDKCQRMMDEVRREIESQATEVCINKMKRSVKEKGIQNRIMEKEIDLHCDKAETLRKAIFDLKEKIEQLQLTLHEDRKRMRPLMALEKCLPDTELYLNIPVHELPPL